MSVRRARWRLIPGLALAAVLAACGPPVGLPAGPTPIPTLFPVTEVPTSLGTPTPAGLTIQSYPAQPPSAEDGSRIFAAYCAECHGADGTGAVPGARNFRDLDYMRGETPSDFYAAITEGRGGMPAYQSTLSSDDRWDTVFFIWRLSTTASILDQGLTIYQRDCASCHGADGSGELLGSADFTDLRQMDRLAPRDLYLTVTQGRGSMPAWQARLSQDERWAVIDYLRTFTFDPSLPGEPQAAPAPTNATTAPACDASASNPFAWDDAATIATGQELYTAACTACHGVDGKGTIATAPDLTDPAFQARLREEPGAAWCVIAEGEGAMPGWSGSLSLEQMWSTLTYIGALGP